MMRRITVRGRMLALYIALAIVPTVIVFSLYMRSYISNMERDIAQTVLQTLKQASLNITNELMNLRRISDTLFVNDDIRLSLRTGPGQQDMNDQLSEITRLRNAIDAAGQGSSVRAIRLYVNDDKIYANQRILYYPISEFQADPRFSQVTSKGEFVETYRASYLDQDYTGYVISLARLIKDVRQVGLTIGALVIDIDESDISRILNQMEFPQDYLVYLTGADGAVISHPGSELFGQQRPPDIAGLDGRGESIRREGDTFYVVKRVDTTDWCLVAELPRSSMRMVYLSTRAGFIVYLGISVFFLFVLFLVTVLIIDGVARRIQRLVQVLGGQQADPALPAPESTAPSPGIYGALDSSLESVGHLISSLYKQMEEQRRTQLQLLQAQINPHFLYNTLDTVQWMVRGGETAKTEQVIAALTRYLRLILNNGRDIVTVSDEVSLSEAYIEIQRQRFGDSFEVEFIVEAEAACCLLPKMTLQPVIENALLHGINKARDRRGRIDIDIFAEEEMLVLSVTDNGIGMNREQMTALLRPVPGKRSGFGLTNVDQRIRLFSGEGEFGVSVESEPGKYSMVTMRLARRTEED